MKIHKKLPALIYAGCGLSLTLVILVGAISLYFSETQKQKEQLVDHTYQVLVQVHGVHRHLYEMEMYKQRYRITGLDSFPQYYSFHSDSLLNDLKALNMLVADNPQERMNIKLLRAQIGGLLLFWQKKDTDLFNSNIKSVLRVTWSEKAKMDSIRLQIARVSNLETELLKHRQDGSNSLRARTEFAIFAGTLLILIIVCLLIYFILLELKNRIRAYQKEKEINQLKSNFVSLASHEFRTPLSSILLSASLIEKHLKLLDAAVIFKHTQKIKTAVNNLKGILDDFFSLEKLDEGKIKAVFEPFDLVELCEEITEEMQHITDPGQTLSFMHNGSQRIVNLDKNLVRNAVINLVGNSVKYAGGNAVIMIETDILDREVIIAIKDNGTGIAEQDQMGLFTPFFRVNSNGKIPGTGLGLNIVLRYVNLMHGAISFSSIPHKETCFKMSFPNGSVI